MNKTLFSMLLVAGAGGLAQGAAAQDVKITDKNTAMCIGCHGIPGYQASFPEVHKVPMIAGQNAKYIASALAAYQKGERKHPTMRSIAASLSEQDMAGLAAFYEQQGKAAGGPAAAELPKAEPTGQVAELVKKGNCISCHGDNFSKPIDASYPKLAGQHADYLYVAMKEYQTQNNPQVGRANPVMMGMVLNFNHKELKALAQYISSLPGELKTVPQSRFR